MSSEPAKSEVDCAVAPYSHHNHHHHHHNLLPHQNPHLQHHHNPRPAQPLRLAHELERPDEKLETTETQDKSEDDDVIEDDKHEVQLECNEGQIDGLTKLVTGIDSDQSKKTTIDSNLGQLTQLKNVVNHQTQVECGAIALNNNYQNESVSPSSTSCNSDISGDDGEEADDDSEEEEDDEDEDSDGENENDDEDEDDDDYDDEEIGDDDIVDPVGHQPNGLLQRTGNYTDRYDCSNINLNCYDRISNNHASAFDGDVAFENHMDESNHDNSATGVLDSERMLEVTRKLVRSTERDPDRDLRKQVLLRTAIRRLPHFMEYNHYSESFDQSFQMQNNTLDSNNTTVTCMSPAQYYEHNHLNHQIDSQPKSYYNSVQPNAIQMSTTSLRMLDLNDDSDSEQAIISLESKHHSDHVYESQSLENGFNQTGLEQQQQDYANHHIYNQHYPSLDTQPATMVHEHHQGAIHDFSQYESNQESNGGMMSRHSTIENLYQPLESSDMNNDLKVTKRSTAFESASGFGTTPDYEIVSRDAMLEKNDINDNMINAPTQNNNVLNLDKEDTASIHRDIIDHSYHQNHDCNQNQTDTTAFYDSNKTQEDPIHLTNLETSKSTSPNPNSTETNPVETIDAIEEDQSGCSESGSSSSSQSSTASDDSVNSTSSKSNDSAGDLSGISMLETSLNTSEEHRYNHSYDSGVALFSPRSNKRSSSSIGLDDEMEIDHLTDLTSSNQFNSGGPISTLNQQCKRMRKREIID